MARESSLWKRLKHGGAQLAALGIPIMLTRIENAADTGTPDVEGCINGSQIWIELKSCARPARETTPVRPKCRDSQRDWHAARVAAGCGVVWVLIQVGEGHKASLYLIPGSHYADITAPEGELMRMSKVLPNVDAATVLWRAQYGWLRKA